MNILLPTIGTSGDVYPFIAIGHELQRRGHRAILIANEYFQPSAQRAGLDFISLAPLERYLAALQNPGLWDPKQGVALLAHSIFAAMRDTYDILARFDPAHSKIVTSGLMFGARIAQEKLGFPLTTIHLQPALFWSWKAPPVMAALPFPAWFPAPLKRPILAMVDRFVLDKVLGENTNAFRAELQLPPVRRLYSHWLRSPQQVIGLFPDWFAAPQTDWPRHTRLAGFVRALPQHEGASLGADLLEFLAQGPPPVVFTAGTGMQHGERFFAESIQACALSGQRGIVVTPYRQQLLQTLPPHMHYCEFAAFAALFPRAAAVVHHGGIGTIAEALAAGVPQLIHPTSHDQPDNAARLETLGVSRTIKPKAFQAATVAKCLSELVASPEIKQRSKQYAQRIDFGGALARVCDLVEGRPCGND